MGRVQIGAIVTCASHVLKPERSVPMPDERAGSSLKCWKPIPAGKALPYLWLPEKWSDNDWARQQICGRDRPCVGSIQVRAIRTLATEHSADIALRIGARNVAQVERVLNGKTYTRVH